MRLIVVRETGGGADAVKKSMLAYAFSTGPLQNMILNGTRRLTCNAQGQHRLSKLVGRATAPNVAWIVPRPWQEHLAADVGQTIGYAGDAGLDLRELKHTKRHPWSVVSNGRFAAYVNGSLLEQVLRESDADVLAVTATPDLLAYRERVRLTQRQELVGYRRLYRDSAEPIPIPCDWPHQFFVRRQYVDTVLKEGLLEEFGSVVEKCRSRRLNVRAVAMAGFVIDLGSPGGLLALSEVMLKDSRFPHGGLSAARGRQIAADENDGRISPEARFMGPVLLGEDVCVESGAVIIGPSILCDGSTVRQDALVDSSVLGARAVVERGQSLRRSFVTAPDDPSATVCSSLIAGTEGEPEPMY